MILPILAVFVVFTYAVVVSRIIFADKSYTPTVSNFKWSEVVKFEVYPTDMFPTRNIGLVELPDGPIGPYIELGIICMLKYGK